MSSEALSQIVSLLPALTVGEKKKLISKVQRSFKKVKLNPIEKVRIRQGQYKKDIRSGKALFGKKVR